MRRPGGANRVSAEMQSDPGVLIAGVAGETQKMMRGTRVLSGERAGYQRRRRAARRPPMPSSATAPGVGTSV